MHWTPTLVFTDREGGEQHRFEGYLPPEEFTAQVEIALTRIKLAMTDFAAAERTSEHLAATHPHTDAAPEAIYWAGVARYKATGDATALTQTAERLLRQYPKSIWTKKASAWADYPTAKRQA